MALISSPNQAATLEALAFMKDGVDIHNPHLCSLFILIGPVSSVHRPQRERTIKSYLANPCLLDRGLFEHVRVH
jgi:hypothetical protein